MLAHPAIPRATARARRTRGGLGSFRMIVDKEAWMLAAGPVPQASPGDTSPPVGFRVPWGSRLGGQEGSAPLDSLRTVPRGGPKCNGDKDFG